MALTSVGELSSPWPRWPRPCSRSSRTSSTATSATARSSSRCSGSAPKCCRLHRPVLQPRGLSRFARARVRRGGDRRLRRRPQGGRRARAVRRRAVGLPRQSRSRRGVARRRRRRARSQSRRRLLLRPGNRRRRPWTLCRDGRRRILPRPRPPSSDGRHANAFELSFLAGLPVDDLAGARRAIANLQAMGPRVVLATSLTLADTPANSLDMIAADGGDAWRLRTPRLPIAVNGAGDLIAALFFLHWLKRRAAAEALASAASSVYAVVAATLAAGGRELRIVEAQQELVHPAKEMPGKGDPWMIGVPRMHSRRTEVDPTETFASLTNASFDRKRMTLLTVRHVTTYTYAESVRLGEHRMMLRPRTATINGCLKRLSISNPRRKVCIGFTTSSTIAWRSPSSAGNTRRLQVDSKDHSESHALRGTRRAMLDERARRYPFAYDEDEMPDLARSIGRHYPELDRRAGSLGSALLSAMGRPTETGDSVDDHDLRDQGRA